MKKNPIQKFLELSATSYHAMPSSDEHEMEHNYSHKMAWGRAGVSALKALATACDGVAIKISHNKSGSIDRGYVSGFVSSKDGTKTVYISINDGMNDILYRTAKHPADYTGGSNNTVGINDFGFCCVLSFLTENLK